MGAVSKKDPRRRAREAALQILYQAEIARTDVEGAIQTYFGLQWPGGGSPDPELRAFASDLARETIRSLPRIDPLIADTAERWRPERMAVIDRLILRMAVCELQRTPPLPPAIVINEAMELARTFSTEEAVKFINGILDGIRKKLERVE